MYRLVAVVFAFALAAPLAAQKHTDLMVDVEGVRRTGSNTEFTPGVTRYEPSFRSGGGVGGGVNVYFTDRVSLELKVAALQSRMTVRTMGSDFVATANLGNAQIFPITALLQWHMLEHGTFRPYLGAGVGHIVLRNINDNIGSATGIRFQDPTGAVVDAGFEIRASRRFGFVADARYVPVETNAKAKFVGTSSEVTMHVRPLIASFGVAYHF